MSVSVTMPRLGESVSEGTVTRWLKQEGERVEPDEPLLEVSTDKVDTEIPSPAGGVLQSIKVAEDETVEVGSELAVIDDGSGSGDGDGDSGGGEPPSPAVAGESDADSGTTDSAAAESASEESDEEDQAAASAPEADTPAEPEPEAETATSRPQPPRQREEPQQREEPATQQEDTEESGQEPTYVTPLVRRLAAEHNVDLADVKGTGVGGRIRKQDVLDAASSGGKRHEPQPPKQQQPSEQQSAPAAAPQRSSTPAAAPARASTDDRGTRGAPDTAARGRTEKLSRLRTVIAERMTESLQISAQLTTVVEADLTRIARLRQRARDDFEAREGVKLTYLPFFALATCEALREHPVVNASIDLSAGTATYHDTVHLGVAVDTPRGLLVPVVKDASDLNLAGLARRIDDLAARTRDNHITPDELGGGTFTLTNTGSRGALFDTPIINQPQVGILGTGTVVKRPVVIDDPSSGEVIAIRHIAYLALTYDHRMVDGADAARFLTTVKARLEAGEFEAELGL